MKKKTTTKSRLIGKPVTLALCLTVAMVISMTGLVEPASAHTGCKEDIAEFEKEVASLESALEKEERKLAKGSVRRRIQKHRKQDIMADIQAKKEHLQHIKAQHSCPDMGTLEGRVEALEYKIEDLDK